MNKLDVCATASELYLGRCRYNCNEKTKGGINKDFVATELITDTTAHGWQTAVHHFKEIGYTGLKLMWLSEMICSRAGTALQN